MIEFKFRPIERWPQEPTTRRRRAQFALNYERRLEKLSYELTRVGARTAYIQADVTEHDIRIDGNLRSDSKPRSPRIIVSAQTKHGPISLPCDTYDHWKDNLYAIALSLEALRDVDRHGVTKRGEQYRGLKQITAGDGPINSQEAAAFIAKHCHDNNTDAVRALQILASEEAFKRYYRAAATKLHPDKSGSQEEWFRLEKARVILLDHFDCRSDG